MIGMGSDYSRTVSNIKLIDGQGADVSIVQGRVETTMATIRWNRVHG